VNYQASSGTAHLRSLVVWSDSGWGVTPPGQLEQKIVIAPTATRWLAFTPDRQAQFNLPGLFLFATRTETAVNVANGKTMIVLIKGLFSKDQQIVDNGDGTQPSPISFTARRVRTRRITGLCR